MFSRTESHWGLSKTMSNLLRMGGFYMLLQVKNLSRSGISWSVRSQIKSLKRYSLLDMFIVLISCGLRTELKSPASSHGLG
jgi:hypothetical protein